MYPGELFYKVVFDGYLFIPFFVVENTTGHNFKIFKIKGKQIVTQLLVFGILFSCRCCV